MPTIFPFISISCFQLIGGLRSERQGLESGNDGETHNIKDEDAGVEASASRVDDCVTLE